MICPFCENEVRAGLTGKLRKNVKCNNCGGFIGKDGNWRNKEGLTVFHLRIQNLPAESSFQKMTATETGFLYRDERYGYELVKSIDFMWNHALVNVTMNAIPTGKYHDHTAKLKLFLSDGSSFVQKAGAKGSAVDTYIIPGGLARGTKKLASRLRTGLSPEEQCQELFIVSQIIHNATFEQRAKFYVDTLNQNGSFEYGKFTFYNNMTVTDGKKLFDLQKAEITRSAYSLDLSQKPSNLRHKLLGNNMVIPLTQDRDVIHAILYQIFGIK
jgi:hypothetical protein